MIRPKVCPQCLVPVEGLQGLSIHTRFEAAECSRRRRSMLRHPSRQPSSVSIGGES
jgi:hypothetical protein